jgi:Tfp pilus assembly protein PilF
MHNCGTARGTVGALWALTCVPAAALFFLSSCTTNKYVTHTGQNPTYAVTQNIDRQVKNAKDAGDGDYLTRQLRERLVRDPTDLQARLEIADHYKRTGNPDLALEHYRLAAEKSPDNADVVLLLAKTLRDFNQPAAAIQAAVKFCNQHQSPPPDLLSFIGTVQDDTGQLTEAEATYRRALRQSPELGYLHNNLGYNLLQQRRPADALVEFRRALELDPHSRVATNNLALALLADWKGEAEPREALQQWESISDAATAHNNLATYLMEQGRYRDARKELDTALKLNRNHAAAQHNARLLSDLEKGKGEASAAVVARAPKPERSADESLVTLWKRFKVSLHKNQKEQRPTAGAASPE